MKTLRASCLALVLACAGLLVPAGAASAASTVLTATVDCDATTGVVSTWVSGKLFANNPSVQPVSVEFRRTGGTRVTATAKGTVAPMAQPYTVRANTTSSGLIDAVGYTSTFDPALLYYREKMTVTFKNANTGAVYDTRDGVCDVDQRTVVTLTCDPTTRTWTAAVTGTNGQAGGNDGAGRPATVSYGYTSLSFVHQNEPGFESHNASGWDYTHRVVRAADGTWSDVGYVITGDSTRPPSWYVDQNLTVAVFDQYGTQVGAGRAKCVMFRNGQPEGF